MAPTKNISDRWFGRLYVIGPTEKRLYGNEVLWDCVCECGTSKLAPTRALTSGITKSCGCLQRDIMRALLTTHGHTGKPEYYAWKAAKGRCENPKDAAYPEYGGRGIEFRWTSFEDFLAHVGPKPVTPGVTYELDRIDVNGHYEAGNLRWWPRGRGMRRPRRWGKRPRPSKKLRFQRFKTPSPT